MTHVSVRMSSSLSDIGELEAVKSKIAVAEADLADAKTELAESKTEKNIDRRDRLESFLLELQKEKNRLADEGIIFYQ